MFKKSKEETNQPAPERNARDEALFEALGKSRKAQKRKILITVLVIAAAVLIGLVVLVSVLRQQVRTRFASSAGEVLSAQAEVGTISTVVSGSGMLTNVDTETVTVPEGVEITETLVAFGDTVAEGDLLAIADMASVRAALADMQAQIEELDDQITDAEGDTVSSYISAGVPGRIKRIYAEKGMSVEEAMVEHGALAVISLDGYMALDIETDALTEGETVTVLLSDGETEEGTVDSVIGGTATVLVTDNGPLDGQEVTVQKADGTEAGTGTLYIHNPLKVTGYAGTVSTVSVSENQKVYANTTLFSLKDTATTANYDALLRQRGEAEEELLELLKIQRYGGLTAPISGSVYSVADLDSETVTDLVTLSPDVSMSVTISVDESDILSLELQQEADVTVSSVSDETLTGIVTEIDKTDSSGSYTAVITLDKVAGMLPGMTASVEVRIEGVDNAILIPVDALHETSTGCYVYTSYDEETQEYGGMVDVVPGLSNDDYVEIKSGLSEGDTVYYTEPQSILDMFGNMGGRGFGNMTGGSTGGMPSGGNIPDFSGGGEMPSGGFGGGRGER
ncbi:MAG: HlyD family efflux transporter periplasmic adaptor subunit [Oscillospiraceae bacterium]|nr:HlyD family efflux transporter periplasmic adaptor subunit [Oscillospiraceae bacterium]